jgi:transcriptional regulator GlxA family with amidase domain
LVAQEMRLIKARNNFMVMPHFTFEACPPSDLFLIPGGGGRRADGTPFGTRFEKDNPALLEWVKARHQSNELTLSVCSGSLVLAQAGLLDGLPATSHRGALQELRDISPNIRVLEGRKTVDAGRIVTSGGISAGIDMALDVVARLHGLELAQETAYYMEYDWEPSV